MSSDPLETVDCIAPWDAVRSTFSEHVRESFLGWVDRSGSHFDGQLQFALGRLEEGINLARYFEFAHPETRGERGPLRVLDIGAGNGGVSVGLANDKRFRVTALDMVPNRELLALKRSLRLPIRQVVGDGSSLPLATGAFDVVLLLETIEHVAGAQSLGAEIMRVLAPGGVCMITTPQRMYYLFRPDPHFGVRGLMWLPDPLQRRFVTRFGDRKFVSMSGKPVAYYDVEHIYWTIDGITRNFPEPKRIGAYYLPGWEGAGRGVASAVKRRMRRFFWDRILVYKA